MVSLLLSLKIAEDTANSEASDLTSRSGPILFVVAQF